MPDVGIELGAACMPSGRASDRVTVPGARKSVVRLTDRLDITIVVDWDVKQQNKQIKWPLLGAAVLPFLKSQEYEIS